MNYDDQDYVYGNPYVLEGLSLNGVMWAFSDAYSSNWHPITWLSHMLDVDLYGIQPGLHHITNLILHVINSILLFLLIRKMTGALWRSAFVAALFALHPLHVESVAWISERKDVLSAFFWMLTVYSYVQYTRAPNIKNYLPVLLFFILGLMAKPMVVTLPIVLLLLDYYPLKRWDLDGHIRLNSVPTRNKSTVMISLFSEKLPLFFLSSLSAFITLYVQKADGALKSLDVFPFSTRLANACVSYVKYIQQTIFPFDMAVFYPYPKLIPVWKVIGSCLFLLSIFYLVIKKRKDHPYLLVGWLWYVTTLLPVIGILQVGMQARADRYMYIPSVGLFLMVAWLLFDCKKKWRYRNSGILILSIVVLSVFGGITWRQAQNWANSVKLFEHALAVTNNNYVAHYKLGEAMLEKGDLNETIKHFEASALIHPRIETYNQLVRVLIKKGEMAAARRYFSNSLDMWPQTESPYNNMGLAFMQHGHFSDAIEILIKGIEKFPSSARIHNSLGTVLAVHGDLEKALKYYKRAEHLYPSENINNNIGLAYIRQGKIEEAIAHFQKALQINPKYEKALFNLRKILAIKKDIDNAVRGIQDVLSVDSGDSLKEKKLEQLEKKKEILEKAIAQYKLALSKQPGYDENNFNIYNYKKVDEIRKRYNRFVKRNFAF